MNKTLTLRILFATVLAALVPFVAIAIFKSVFYQTIQISSYLVFHNVAEIFSIIVSLQIFSVGWYSSNGHKNSHSLFLSAAFLVIGFVDLMHMLSYPGMPDLFTANETNKTVQFWIAARFLSAIAFCMSSFIYSETTWSWLTKRNFFLVIAPLIIMIFVGVNFFSYGLPTTFVEGAGLTSFKVFSEYVIVSIFILTFFLYWKRFNKTGEKHLLYFLSAFIVCIMSELFFTFYKSAFDTYNMLGHIYKIAAFALIYKGLFHSALKKTYEDLSQSQTMLSKIINSIPQAVFWKDLDSVFLGCNQVFAHNAGLNFPDDVIGKNNFEFPWLKKEAEAYRLDEQEVMRTGCPKFNIIEEMHLNDGNSLWIKTSKMPLVDSKDKTIGVLGVYEDITDLKKSTFYQSISFAILNVLNETDDFSESLSKILSIIKKETGFESIGVRLKNGDDYPYFAHNGFSDGFIQFENSLLAPNASGGCCKDKEGNLCLECTCGVIISGRTDPTQPQYTKGGSCWTNNSLPALDIPPEEDIRFHPRKRCVHEGYRSIALIPLKVNNEIVGLLQLNDRRENLLSLELVHFFEGISSMISVALIRKQAQERLKTTNHYLQELSIQAQLSSRAKSEFLANISHEIRTPLNSILGFTDYLLETSSDLEVNNYLNRINKSGQTLLSLINNILELSKIESGGSVIENSSIRLLPLINDTFEMLSIRAQKKGIDLKLDIEPNLQSAIVIVDSLKLQRVLLNLLNNSLKFTTQGEVKLVIKRHQAELVFEVHDTGIGIPPEKQSLLFQRFSQLDSSSTKKFEGTGLGLSICKEILDLMGGSICVESSLGKGAVFIFKIPFIEGVESKAKNNSTEGIDPLTWKKPLRILLADDSEENRTLIQLFFKKYPFQMDTASNGKEAVEKFSLHTYDLVLMDIQMPHMDGFEATRKIRDYEKNKKLLETPIIALTGFALKEDKEKCLAAGCSEHIAKPIKKQELLQLIAKYHIRK